MNLLMSTDDVEALTRIYEKSPWIFRQSRFEIQVREAGAVEINIEGDVSRKNNDDGPLWMPIVMVRELPEYYRALNEGEQKQVELEAYRVAGGLWVITAVVPRPTEVTRLADAQSANTSSPSHLKLRALLVSPIFSTNLPLLIPAGQGRGSVDASVILANGTQFSSLRVSSGNEAVPQAAALTVLPTSITGGAVAAASRLSPEPGVAWNFSSVAYGSNVNWGFRPWFIPTIFLIVLSGLTIWWGVERLVSKDVSRFNRETERERIVDELEVVVKEFNEFRGNRLEGELEPELMGELDRLISVIHELRYVSVYQAREIIEHIKYRLDKLIRIIKESERNYHRSNSITRDLYKYLEHIKTNIGYYAELNSSYYFIYERRRRSRRWFWLFISLALIAAIWLLSTFARGQANTQQIQSDAANQLATFGDLGMSIVPQDPHSDNYDKVNVALNFFPLTDIPNPQGTQEVYIGTGNNEKLSIEPFKPADNSRITIVQENGKLLRLSVPTNYAPVIGRLKTLAEWKSTDFSPPSDYFDSIDKATKVNLSYVIKGAQIVKERANNGWFHWFPLDTQEIEVPLELRQPAIVSSIELQRPSFDYTADPSVEGYNGTFVENESGRRYQAVSKEKSGRTAIWAGKLVTIRAKFQRTWFQRFGLTIGQVIIAIIIGVIFGFVVVIPDKSWKAVVIGAFGVLALPWAIRTAILSTYKDLPTIVTFQGITLFEVIFLVNIVIILITCIIVRRRLI
jgi:hypothetical protein